MEVLAGEELIPLVQGSLPEVKRLRGVCLAEDIPVALAAPPGRG